MDAPDIVLEARIRTICNAPSMIYGNKPVDGGNLLLTTEEKNELLKKEPQSEKWLRPLLGAEEFLNKKERWCLWLVGILPSELKSMPEVLKRVQGVKAMRLASVDAQARKLAERATEFRDTQEPESYVLIPCHSSENRRFIPIGFFDKHTITTMLILCFPTPRSTISAYSPPPCTTRGCAKCVGV